MEAWANFLDGATAQVVGIRDTELTPAAA
jgi:hypothetical protein